MKNLSYFILIVLILGSCSSGKNALEKGNYISAIQKSVNRLSNDPDNKKAQRVLEEGYDVAIAYYQEEIDQTLSANDRMKWSRTLSVMEQVNYMAEIIRKIPAAREIIPSPKTYTSELTEVKNKAAEEYYQEGLDLLERNNREDARQAYNDFYEADLLIPSYKDVIEKLAIAKELATLKVIIQPLPSPSIKYGLTADFFYNQVMEKMNLQFPTESFVNIYSPEEANLAGLEYPDMVVVMEFYDFFVGGTKHYEEEKTLSREIEEQVEVQVSRDSVRYETVSTMMQGKIKIITDEVASGGLLDVKILDYQLAKMLVNEQVPGEYIWQNQYGIFVGDEEVLTQEELSIVNNKSVLPPESQEMFLLFTEPIYIQLTDLLTNYFSRYY